MTSCLIDINVWLAMTWDQHPQHRAAVRWRQSEHDARFLFCRLTMLGFLRLLTNQSVMGDSSVTLDGALQIYDQWTQDPQVSVAPEPRGTEDLFRLALSPLSGQRATKAIADCYLVAFAGAAGARVATFDKGLAATAKLQDVPVMLIPASRAEGHG